jgi:phosphatidyl-myo-inositol dimannoside synthase
MAMDKKVLFLTLRVFSATGGIEKVCRVFAKALTDISASASKIEPKVLSMYDGQADVVSKYISPVIFTAFNSRKIQFVVSSLLQGSRSDAIIISHINLLSIGYLVKLFFPKKKLLLFVHGIEVWDNLSLARKKMLYKCDVILSVSQFTKDKLLGQCEKMAEEKVVVLNNCLDPFLPPRLNSKDDTLLKKYGLSKSNIILLTLTRMSSKELYKGYDNVLYSIKTLKEKYPAIKYMIVGRYDEAEKHRLDNIIQQHSLQQHVVFTGYIPDEELAAHYSLADVYVMPSKKEGFGIVFIEAMYYGLPVIAGNKDGSVDAVGNGKLGILVDPDDQQNIDRSIEQVMLHTDSYKPDKTLLNQLFSYDVYKTRIQDIFSRV